MHVTRTLRAKERDYSLTSSGSMNKDDRRFGRAVAEVQVTLGNRNVRPGELGREVSSRSIEHAHR